MVVVNDFLATVEASSQPRILNDGVICYLFSKRILWRLSSFDLGSFL